LVRLLPLDAVISRGPPQSLLSPLSQFPAQLGFGTVAGSIRSRTIDDSPFAFKHIARTSSPIPDRQNDAVFPPSPVTPPGRQVNGSQELFGSDKGEGVHLPSLTVQVPLRVSSSSTFFTPLPPRGWFSIVGCSTPSLASPISYYYRLRAALYFFYILFTGWMAISHFLTGI